MKFSDELWSQGRVFLESQKVVFEQDAWLRLRFDLEKFLELFFIQNENLNLTGIKEPEAVFWKHLIDSLLVLQFPNLKGLVDWGTGGGYPGIPLCLAHRARGVTEFRALLLDSIRKKVVAVQEFISAMEISGVSCEWGRGELLVPKLEWKVSAIVMRAVAPPERAVPWVEAVGGRWILMLAPVQVAEWKSSLTLRRRGVLEYFKPTTVVLPSGMGERALVDLCFVPRGTK